MPKLVLFALGILALLILSRRVRGIVFHVHVRRFFTIVAFVTAFAAIGVLGYLLWKYWWPIYMAKPTVEYYDYTIEQDLNPETPGTGGPATPVIIQTR